MHEFDSLTVVLRIWFSRTHHAAVREAAVGKLPCQQHRCLGDQLNCEVFRNIWPHKCGQE